MRDYMIDIGIDKNNCKQVAEILNKILANEYVLYTKTLNFHWNIEGRQFHDLHKFFEHLYEQLLDINDDVAERVRSIGFKSFGTLSEFSKHTTLPEGPGDYPEALSMISILLADHETIIKQLRLAVDSTLNLGDAGTSNFLTDLMEKHEKIAWMLRSHLAK